MEIWWGNQMTKLLTKSKYLMGLQCPRLLWIAVNEKESMPQVDESQQRIFDRGTEIGVLATTLFKGVKVPEDSFMGNINKTKKLLEQKKTLFEPGFMVDGLFSRGDILEYTSKGWNIIEVKSSTEVKDVNIQDVSFQKYVYEKAGLKINKCYLMCINNQYVRKRKLDVSKLFKQEDITQEVEEFTIGIQERISKMQNILNGSKPKPNISKSCSDPYNCALENDCWGFLPKNSVFNLYRGGKKSWELYGSDIIKIKSIPNGFDLTTKQEIQRNCELKKNPFIHKESIKSFIKRLKYPIYYFDFETINPVIPLYDGLRPYQRMAFQYSLHIQEKEGGGCKHISFLADEKKDPRKAILDSMKENLGHNGTILAWNQGFEIGVIKELSEQFPEYSKWAQEVIERFDDLIIPFKNFHYYNSVQEGSASLKKVLPALTNLSYGDLEIGNGGDASNAYEIIATSKVEFKEVKKIRDALKIYCELDTWAEVKILEALKKLIL